MINGPDNETVTMAVSVVESENDVCFVHYDDDKKTIEAWTYPSLCPYQIVGTVEF